MHGTKVVFDIETIGADFDSLEQETQDYLLKYAKNKEEEEETKSKLALFAPMAEIVAIGMLNPDTNKGVIYYQNKGEKKEEFSEGDVLYKSGSEAEILKNFWDSIKAYKQFITFNGRSFDGPMLMLRSAMVGVKPTRNLVPYRYSTEAHIDLLDQLIFYGATRKFNLEAYCKAFGIQSPKGEISGDKVGEYYKNGKCLDIAKYCYKDIVATAELYKKWDQFLNIK